MLKLFIIYSSVFCALSVTFISYPLKYALYPAFIWFSYVWLIVLFSYVLFSISVRVISVPSFVSDVNLFICTFFIPDSKSFISTFNSHVVSLNSAVILGFILSIMSISIEKYSLSSFVFVL